MLQMHKPGNTARNCPSMNMINVLVVCKKEKSMAKAIVEEDDA